MSTAHASSHGLAGATAAHTGRRRSLSSLHPETATRTTGSAIADFHGDESRPPNVNPTTTTAVEDQLQAMLRSEDVYTPSLCVEAMSKLSSRSSRSTACTCTSWQGQGHTEWRSKICEWSYRVIDHFRYDREVVSVAMNYFDRYLVLVGRRNTVSGTETANGAAGANSGVGSGLRLSTATGARSAAVIENIDSRTYQLAAMTALYVATKLHADRVDPLPLPQVQPQVQVQGQPQAQATSSTATNTTTTTRPNALNATDHRRSSVNQNLVQHGLPSAIPPTPDAPQKVHRSKLRLSSFVELSRGQFSAKDITDMERHLLDVLGWRVNPPTPMVLVSHLLRVMPLFGRPGTSRNACGSATTTTTTIGNGNAGTDPASLQHRTLVLHVLHELSRYLTELSICLPPTVSSTHTSSELAFVAILLSLDLLSDVTAVPRAVRLGYLQRLDWLSGGRLNARRTKVVELKDTVGRAFVPDMLQDSLLAAMGGGEGSANGAAGSANASGSGGSGGHPILIARDAGLLSEEVERRCGGRCFAPTPTPIDPTPAPVVAPSVAAAEMEVEVEFNPPPPESAIIRANANAAKGGINTSFHPERLIVSASTSPLAGASADSFDIDIDDDDDDLEYTTVDPETGRNRSVNCVAEQTVLQLQHPQQPGRDPPNKTAKRSDKYVQHQHPFHADANAAAPAGLPETHLENTTSTGTAPPGHVRNASCSSWMSDSSESPISVIAEALNAAAAMGGGCGSAPSAASAPSSSGGTAGQARPPTHQAHHQAPAQGYLL